jgi:hypothetical protein
MSGRGKGWGPSKYSLLVIVAVLVFGFSPISRALLRVAHGSFAPAPYTSLSLANTAEIESGVAQGQPVEVTLMNHTGYTTSYQWTATQNHTVLSRGDTVLRNGQVTQLVISSTEATVGRLRIGLVGTDIFVTVSILKPVA